MYLISDRLQRVLVVFEIVLTNLHQLRERVLDHLLVLELLSKVFLPERELPTSGRAHAYEPPAIVLKRFNHASVSFGELLLQQSALDLFELVRHRFEKVEGSIELVERDIDKNVGRVLDHGLRRLQHARDQRLSN